MASRRTVSNSTPSNQAIVPHWLLCLACLVCLVFAWQLAAADPPTAEKSDKPAAKTDADNSALDEALLKDLDNELLDDAGDLKERPGKKSVERRDDDKKPDDPSAIGGEDIGQPSAEEDPFLYISEEMRSAESQIPERSKRSHVEVTQRRIVEDLARLIEQAENQQAGQQSASSKDKKQQSSKRQSVQQSKPSSGGSTGKESNQAATDSTDRLGKAKDVRPDAELVRGLMKDTWGHLPERAREQMLQSSPEKFVPQYELMIERYYKRLAEERNPR